MCSFSWPLEGINRHCTGWRIWEPVTLGTRCETLVPDGNRKLRTRPVACGFWISLSMDPTWLPGMQQVGDTCPGVGRICPGSSVQDFRSRPCLYSHRIEALNMAWGLDKSVFPQARSFPSSPDFSESSLRRCREFSPKVVFSPCEGFQQFSKNKNVVLTVVKL